MYYPNCKSLESLWTELDLNHKHITLETFSFADATQSYISECQGYILQYYSNMDCAQIRGVTWGSLGAYNDHKFTGDCGRDLKRLISDIFSNYQEPHSDNNNFLKLHEMISSHSSNNNLLAYISFNYDCFLEDAIKEFRYIGNNELINFDEPMTDSSKQIIVKLHGSLNWEHRSDFYTDIRFGGSPFRKEHLISCEYKTDAKFCQPAMIPPTLFKQEINYDLQMRDKLSLTILNQWRNAVNILENADKVLFIGYSFPHTDFHVKRIFRIAKMQREKTKKASVQILSVIGSASEENCFREKVEDIYGAGVDMKFVYTFCDLNNSQKPILENFLKN